MPTIRVGQFVNGRGLGKALRKGLRAEMRRWAELERAKMRAAHGAGGHPHHGGRRWKRRKQAYRHPLLLRTGRLQRGTNFTLRGSNQYGSRVTFFNRVPYARNHQFGTRHMPARPPLEISRRDVGTLKTRITKWGNRAINGAHARFRPFR